MNKSSFATVIIGLCISFYLNPPCSTKSWLKRQCAAEKAAFEGKTVSEGLVCTNISAGPGELIQFEYAYAVRAADVRPDQLSALRLAVRSNPEFSKAARPYLDKGVKVRLKFTDKFGEQLTTLDLAKS